MKSIITIVGTVLIILGIIGFSNKYITYTTNEKVAEIGNIQVTADTEKAFVISPLASVLAVGAGLVLVVLGLSRK